MWKIVARQVFTPYDCFNIDFSSVCCSLSCWLSQGNRCEADLDFEVSLEGQDLSLITENMVQRYIRLARTTISLNIPIQSPIKGILDNSEIFFLISEWKHMLWPF